MQQRNPYEPPQASPEVHRTNTLRIVLALLALIYGFEIAQLFFSVAWLRLGLLTLFVSLFFRGGNKGRIALATYLVLGSLLRLASAPESLSEPFAFVSAFVVGPLWGITGAYFFFSKNVAAMVERLNKYFRAQAVATDA